MWVRSAVVVFSVLALQHSAQARSSWYWCEPAHAYYPWVKTCAEPWRAVNPWTASRQPGTAPPSQPAVVGQSQQTASAGPAPQPTADQGEKPNFAPQNFPARSDELDEWCKGVTTALNVALCGDDELRILAIQRLRAFDDAVARVPADQRKVLAADQNGWAMSYPQGCALASNVLPSLPLAPAMRECLAQAGRSRLTYLQAYGRPAENSAPSSATEAPSPASIRIPAAVTQSAGQSATPTPAPTSTPQPTAPQPAAVPVPSNSPAPDVATPAHSATPSRWSKLFVSPVSNPLSKGRFLPETLRGAAMIAGFLVAAIAVGLWIIVVLCRMIHQRRRDRVRAQ